MNLTFISAGAGSGKTFRLTSLLGEQLTSGKVRPEGLIATTFTRKAAAELRERVRTRLLKHRQWAHAAAIDSGYIGTVNGMGSVLLKRFAFQAGLSPELTVLDEAPARALLDEVADTTLDDGQREALNRLSYRLEKLDQGAPVWQSELMDIINAARSNGIGVDALPSMAQTSCDLLLGYFSAPVASDWDGELQRRIEESLPKMRSLLAGLPKPPGISLDYVELLEDIHRDVVQKHLSWTKWLKLSRGECGARLRELNEPIQVWAAAHQAHPGLHEDIRSYTSLLFDCAAQIMQAYAEAKDARALIDFTDQEQRLLQVLSHPDVEARLADELDLLMVDEFQDTNPIQLAIFLKLARLAKQTYWVGDIKQAIYGFRGSDSALMEQILAELTAQGCETQTLAQSWRSRPALVELVNEWFDPVFDTLPSEQVCLQAARSEQQADASALETWLLAGNKAQQQSALVAQIRALMASGRQVVDKHSQSLRPLRYSDIAVLVRQNVMVASLAQTLQQQQVPVAAGLPGLLATPECVLALACLRRLYDASDTIASAEIISLTSATSPEDWLQDRLDWLEKQAAPSEHSRWGEVGTTAHPILARLADLRIQLEVRSPLEALQLAIQAVDLPGHVLHWQTDVVRGKQRLANLDALLEMADNYQEQCKQQSVPATVAGLLLWLDEQGANESDIRATPDVDAVQVLTHHGAKGLEWPITICFELEAQPRSRLWGLCVQAAPSFDLYRPLADRQLRYWLWPYGAMKSAEGLEALEQGAEAEQARKAAIREGQRLLYVSMTRARDVLVLALSQGNRATGERWIDLLGQGDLTSLEGRQIELPNGTAVPFARVECEAPNDPPEFRPDDSAPLHWWQDQTPVEACLPWLITPSHAEAYPMVPGQPLVYGPPLMTPHALEAAERGSALHAAFAASFSQPTFEWLPTWLVQQTLDPIDPHALLNSLQALQQWLQQRWHPQAIRREWPVSTQLGNGQCIVGNIDLLLEVEDGWVVLDYKFAANGSERRREMGEKYGGQLHCYRQAIEVATGRPVLESWLVYPFDGVAVPYVAENGLPLSEKQC